jgi:hypothetical protein
MRPKSHGIITTRGRDVMNAQGEEGPEPMSMITSRDTYQKGFTPSELEEYLRYMLGDDYDINKLNLGSAGAMIQKKAIGGIAHMSNGGIKEAIKQGVKQGAKKAKKMSPALKAEMDATRFKELNPATRDVTAPMRAEAGRKAATLIASQPQIKLSEALGNLNVEGKGKLITTQSDRTRVGGGNIGGAPFSAISEADPNYKGNVWGVMDSGTASRIINLNDPNTIWTTMLGAADQLKSNPIVFNKLKRGFQASLKQGNLTPELEARINQKLATFLGEGADIRDPQIWNSIDTFEKRAKMADVMQGIGIGGEKSGKGVIFKPTDILKEETEPSLLHPDYGGEVPTFAIGPRLFTLTGEQSYRPDLHPGFPTLLHGEDKGMNVMPTETEIGLPYWHKHFNELVEKANIEKLALGQKQRTAPAGYYDLALGIKGEGLPSQDINEEYLKWLQQHGRKDGGVVKMAKGGTPEVSIEGVRYEPEGYTDPMGMTVPSQDDMKYELSKQNMSPMPYSEPYRDPITGAILERGMEALPQGFNIPKTGGMTPIDWDNLPEEEKKRTFGDYVSGVLEPTATVATGAGAFMAGLPIAFGKGLMGGDFNQSMEDIMRDYTYIPRSQQGLENLEMIGKGLEASKLPALMPELHGLEPIISLATKRGLQLGKKGIKETGKAVGERAYNKTEDFLKSQGLMPAITPEMKPSVTIEPFSPKDEFGFYSKLEKETQKIQRKQGNGQAFKNDLLKLGVKPYELEQTGMDEFLKNNKSLTRDDVIGYAQRNRPEMTETILGKDAKFDIEHSAGRSDQLYYDVIYKDDGSMSDLQDSYDVTFNGNLVGHIFETNKSYPEYYTFSEIADSFDGPFYKKSEAEDAIKNALEMEGIAPMPKHKQHFRTKGGENYREVLVQTPQKDITKGELLDDMARRLGAKNFESLPMEQRHEIARLAKGTPFISGHYEEFPNTMINMRMDDRVDVDGKRGTLLDELQSDWHQKGRDEGYQSKLPTNLDAGDLMSQYGDKLDYKQMAWLRDFNERWELADSDAVHEKMVDEYTNWLKLNKTKGVPDAPYKNNWYKLGLNKAIQQSVEKGDDRLYLSTGQTLADRYDLSKQISEVHYSGTNLKAYDHNGDAVIEETGISKEQLPEYIGKEATKKLLEQEPKGTLRSLIGLDLKVGGEGMNEWYDKKYLSYLNEFAKKYGGKVGETEIETAPAVFRLVDENGDLVHSAEFDTLKDAKRNIEGLKISGLIPQDTKIKEMKGEPKKVYYYEPSPEAKKKIKGGLPYKDGGMVKMAGGGGVKKVAQMAMKTASQGKVGQLASKDLLTAQDFHTSIGDEIRARAKARADKIAQANFKYKVGDRVFTDWTAKNNYPPYEIVGQDILGGKYGKILRDPDTGKYLRDENGVPIREEEHVGYQVKHDFTPHGETEPVSHTLRMPESTLSGLVEPEEPYKRGGVVRMDKGGSVDGESINLTPRRGTYPRVFPPLVGENEGDIRQYLMNASTQNISDPAYMMGTERIDVTPIDTSENAKAMAGANAVTAGRYEHDKPNEFKINPSMSRRNNPNQVVSTLGHEGQHLQENKIKPFPINLNFMSDNAKRAQIERNFRENREYYPEFTSLSAYGESDKIPFEERMADLVGYESILPKGQRLVNTSFGKRVFNTPELVEYYESNARPLQPRAKPQADSVLNKANSVLQGLGNKADEFKARINAGDSYADALYKTMSGSKFSEGGSVAEQEIAKMREILGMNKPKDIADMTHNERLGREPVKIPYEPTKKSSAKPTVGLEPIQRGGSRIPSTQLELYKKKGGNVSIDDMRLALMRKI